MRRGLILALCGAAVHGFVLQAPQRAWAGARTGVTCMQAQGNTKAACSAIAALVVAASPVLAIGDVPPVLQEGGSSESGGIAIVQEQQLAQQQQPVEDINPVQQLAQQATAEQVTRVRAEQQEVLRRDALREPGELIARVVVSIKSDAFPLGFPDVGPFPELDTEDARLIVTAFGRSGPPVASRRVPLKGLKFPALLELTADDLAFPLTKEVWLNDARAQDEIGVAVVLDVDGKLATLDAGDLTGYGISKPIKLGGQVQRTEAIVTVQVNKALEEKGQAALPSMEIAVLERIDALLDLKESIAATAAAAPAAPANTIQWGWNRRQ
ncbi:hypothetical protein JKP88DRAFT_224551 [Tribonema minus]|uniref:Uncharacterized protein n=1 Tax=Tribonema minus TaxID=303371 RepID=A0A836CAJ8_9STRA|nr:hypothetical protein JKP88DRAFT_224551 [Tribonema minus]